MTRKGMDAVTVAFAREAAEVLRNGGYELERKTGKEHQVWRHPDADRPLIHVPATPGKPDAALVRLRRAVRKGTTPYPKHGVEMAGRRTTNGAGRRVVNKPLHEKLIGHAPPSLQKRAGIAARGESLPSVTGDELATWLRRCLEAHGAIPGSELMAAAQAMQLETWHLSTARKATGAIGYRLPGASGPRDETYTDFAKRVPADAIFMGGRGKKRPAAPVKVSQVSVPPKDPDEGGGRRLDRPEDMTDEQYEAAERMMRESTERADAELAAHRANTDHGPFPHRTFSAITAPGNGNGAEPRAIPSGMQAALDLLLAQAIEETHALTHEDLMMLRGTYENCRRLASDLEGMAAGLSLLLRRVEQRVAETQ